MAKLYRTQRLSFPSSVLISVNRWERLSKRSAKPWPKNNAN